MERANDTGEGSDYDVDRDLRDRPRVVGQQVARADLATGLNAWG